MSTEKELVFAALALREGAISSDTLSHALGQWRAKSNGGLGAYLESVGFLTPPQRAGLQQSVDAELARHAGDPIAALEAIGNEDVKSVLFRFSTIGAADDDLTVHLPAETSKTESSTNGGQRNGHSTLPSDQGARRTGRPHTDDEPTILTRAGQESGADTVPTVYQNAPGAKGSGHVRVSAINQAPGDASTERYNRSRLHGQGGVGRVWLAVDVKMGREVALKELRPERASNSRLFSRFVEEAKITGQLEHPSIVPVYELAVDEATGHSYYTMRFIRGKTLAEASTAYDEGLKAGKEDSLAFRNLLTSFVGVCHAVAYAHSRGVIHRDLKGQNVVLGDYGEVIVLDWGLAKRVDHPSDEVATGDAPEIKESSDHTETMQGEVLGTPAYMAPEQAAGDLKAIDQRSDIYSLGAILYEIICGKRPFVEHNTQKLLRLVRESEPPPPRSIRTSTSPALESIVQKAMKKNPDERYQTASELAREVSRWMADEPVEAHPDPWSVRAARWAKRHRTLVTSAAAALFITALGLAIGTFLVARERDRALAARDVAQTTVDTFFSDVGAEWLEDHSDALQRRFMENALAFYDPTSSKQQPSDTKTAPAEVRIDPQSELLDPKQREFIENALTYYQRFASENANDPSTRLKAATARLRVAMIMRKLGHTEDASREFETAISQLAAGAAGDQNFRRELALARERYAELLTSLGKFDASHALLDAAISELRAIPGGEKSREIQSDLARALRSAADVAKFGGDFADAEGLLDQSIDAAERAVAIAPKDQRARFELATGFENLGFVLLAQSKAERAAISLRKALELLDSLLADSPTRVDYRDALAKTANTLALVSLNRGAQSDASALLTRSIRDYERLAGDFPARPEYQRGLARGLVNLAYLEDSLGGNLETARAANARAIDVLSRLVKQNAAPFKIRRDLARVQNNLGGVLSQLNDHAAALDAFERAERLNQALLKEHPNTPEFLQSLAICRMNQGRVLVLDARPQDGLAKLEQSLANYEQLVQAHGNVPEYQDNQATCMRYLGDALVALDRSDDAKARYQSSLALAATLVEEHPDNLTFQRNLADTIIPYNELFHPDDQVVLARKALGIYERLASSPGAAPADRKSLAAAQTNLGEYLAAEGVNDEARTLWLAAADNFATLSTADPISESQRLSYVAYVRSDLGDLEARLGELQKAAEHLRMAVDAQVAAINANRGTADRATLVEYCKRLSSTQLKQGDSVAVANLANELVKYVPELSSARVAAAEMLAKAQDAIERETNRPESERRLLARVYRSRAVAQIRAAVDGGLENPASLTEIEALRPLFDGDELRDLLPEKSGATSASVDSL